MDEKRVLRGPFRKALLAAAVVAFLFVLPLSVLRLNGVQEVESRDGRLYGINVGQTESDIFEVSPATGEGSFLRVTQVTREGIYNFADLEVSGNGEVFLVQERYLGDEKNEVSLVCWNRTADKLEIVKVLPDTGNLSFVNFIERNGDFYFLFYNKSGAGEGSQCAFLLTRAGDYTKWADIGGMDWDYNVSGVSEASLPVRNVRLPVRTIAGRYLLAVLLCLIAEIGGWLVFVWWKTRGSRLNLVLRLSFLAAAGLFLLIVAFNVLMQRYLFSYISEREINACQIEADFYKGVLEPEFLDELVSGEDPEGRTEYRKKISASRQMNSAIAWFDGEEVCLLGDLFRYGLDEARFSGGSLKDALVRIRESGQAEGFLYVGDRGNHAMAVRPSKTLSGKDVFLLVQTSMRSVRYDFLQMRRSVLRICMVLLFSTLIVTLLVLFRCLKPLKELTEAVERLGQGHLDTRTPVRGHTELAAAAMEFNRMAEQLETKQDGTDAYRHFYEAFLPIRLVRAITGKAFSASLEPGASVTAKAVTLHVGLGGVCGAAGEELLSCLIGIAQENGGEVVSIGETSLRVLFGGRAEEALFCALTMQRSAREKAGAPVFMGMASGEAGLLVVGNAERRGILAEDSGEAAQLMEIAGVLNDALVLTEEIAEQAEASGNAFHFRCIGPLAHGEFCSEQPLYELLDAEQPETRRRRESRKDFFENGVRAYMQGDYFAARNDMIECLRADPGDRAARSYCMNCDRKEPPAICQIQR